MKSEFRFIEALKEKWLLNAIGDDCAVVPRDGNTDLVITSDLLIEDIDFRLDWSSPEFIGHKALAVSLSDIAAMGARPLWSITSIGIPEKLWSNGFADKFYDGYMALAKRYGVELIGGDVSRSPDKFLVDSVVVGEVEKGRAVFRSGAMPGDLIFVSGYLGGAAGGLLLLEEGIRYPQADRPKNLLLQKQLTPAPKLPFASYISKYATAMIDISDGLSSDLMHICRASNTGAKLFSEKIPHDPNLSCLAIDFAKSLSLALNGGEDFELLFTINPNNANQIQDAFEIGVVTSDAGKAELASSGPALEILPGGFRHF